VGATKRPAYRVIAIDKRRSRDGRALEILGYYDPLTEPATLHLEREKIQAWIGKGAQPSETVQKLLRQAESKPAAPDEAKPRRATRASDAKPSKKARAKAAVTDAPTTGASAAEAPAAVAAEPVPADEPASEASVPAAEHAEPENDAEAETAGSDDAAGADKAAEPEKADA
jgi:small subunit ribosomal protein S16